MTQEDKDLLLKDLSARLPYGVKLKHIPSGENTTLEIIGCGVIDGNIHDLIENFKPYLRPLSSMTVEEFKEWLGYCKADYDCEFKPELTFNFESCLLSINWLNQHHFDYGELIEKGLAIAVTEENNPYKV